MVLWFSSVHGSGELAALLQGLYTNSISSCISLLYFFFPEVTGYWGGLSADVLRL